MGVVSMCVILRSLSFATFFYQKVCYFRYFVCVRERKRTCTETKTGAFQFAIAGGESGEGKTISVCFNYLNNLRLFQNSSFVAWHVCPLPGSILFAFALILG